MAIQYTITQDLQDISYTITPGVGPTGPAGSSASVTNANVNAAIEDDPDATKDALAIVSADVTDATSDGAANKGKVLKTDAGGTVRVELLQSVGQIDIAGAGITYHALTSTPTANTSTDFPPYSGEAQYRPLVKSANFSAVNGQTYHTTATLTVTDPTPAEGAGFEVLVRNGTATVGGTAYAVAGTVIRRVYHSGAWANYVTSGTNTGDQDLSGYATKTGSETLTNKTLDAPIITNAAQFTSTTRPTSSGTGTPAATSLITRDDGDARYGAIQVARLTSDESITNSTTLTEIGPTLTLEAGIYVVFQMMNFYNISSAPGGNGGLMFSQNVNFSGRVGTNPNGSTIGASTYGNDSVSSFVSAGFTGQYGNTTTEGIISVSSTTTVRMAIKQLTSSADATKAQTNSFVMFTKIA